MATEEKDSGDEQPLRSQAAAAPEFEDVEHDEVGSTVAEANSEEEADGDACEDADEEAPTHLPFAPPSDELHDDSTTVDPSYIISLVRMLLPKDHTLEEGKGLIGKEVADKIDVNVDEDFQELAEKEDVWEDCGCILWDLSASKTQAEFMIDNLILDVLLANLHVSQSPRVKEICVGIIGNLACHETLANTISSLNDLVHTVVSQLFLDDSACLVETFRVLAVALQGNTYHSWTEALRSDEILSRVLWIIGNTLNYTLFEKAMELLLAICTKQEPANILLPSLVTLGLVNNVLGLLKCEVENSRDETKTERPANLTLLLHLVEELSTLEICAPVMSTNEELLRVICDIMRLPNTFEVACCNSAVIVLANLLTEEKLLSTFSHDFCFLEGLFEILPQVSEDSDARDALWWLLGRSLVLLQKDRLTSAFLQQLVSLIVNKFDVIQMEVYNLPSDDLDESVDSTFLRQGVSTSLKGICNILEQSISEKSSTSNILEQSISEKSSTSTDDDKASAPDTVEKARKLLGHFESSALKNLG